jgi:hypothetical protein
MRAALIGLPFSGKLGFSAFRNCSERKKKLGNDQVPEKELTSN